MLGKKYERVWNSRIMYEVLLLPSDIGTNSKQSYLICLLNLKNVKIEACFRSLELFLLTHSVQFIFIFWCFVTYH